MDTKLNELTDLIFKVKDRTLRKELMSKVEKCKPQVVSAIALLRDNLNGRLSNQITAQINDLAFKAVRPRVNKQLDQRAMKNESIFEANDQKLKALAKKVDKAKLLEQHKDIIQAIGDCPMSQCNVIELMEQGDCMCLCLDISRSEATINDPSTLNIRNIVPNFISLDSFLESSIFKMK